MIARSRWATAAFLSAALLAACTDGGPASVIDTETSTGGASSSSGTSPGTSASTEDTADATSEDGTSGSSGDTGDTADSTGDDETTGGPTVTVDAPIRIVYLADEDTIGTDELWLRDEADYDAGPLRLSHTLPALAFISPFFPVASDGRWLVYRMIQPGPGSQHELWAVDISVPAPEAPFRVDDTGALVHEYAITPNGSALVWIGASGIHTSSLRAASPGTVVTHTPAPTGEGTYGLFEVAADSDTVIYTADPDGSGIVDAFAISLSKGTPAQLSDLSAPGTEVDGNSLQFASGGVVYQADRDVAEPEIFWVSLSGGAPVKVNAPVVDEALRTERLAPGGGAIAWWSGYPGAPDMGTVHIAALDTDGPSAPIDVHDGQPGMPQEGRIVWSADGSALLYSVFFVDRLESWVAAVDAGVPGTPVRITGDVLADGEHLVAHVFDADGNVFYVAGTEAGDELFFVDRSSGAPAPGVKVSPTPVGAGLSGDLRFSPDGTQLLFTGLVDSASERDLYRADLSIRPPFSVERIETDLQDGADVTPGPIFSADGAHILYTVTSADETERHLYDLPPGGTGFTNVLPISTGGYVTAYTPLP
jgi:hypothetical protein